MLRSSLLFVLVVLVAGCSSRTTPADRGGGPIWPDLRPDGRRRADHRIELGVDAGPDRSRADLPSPDRWIYDFRPEQPKVGWQQTKLFLMEDLHDVACVDGHVFAVGAKGTIIHRGPSDTAFVPQSPPPTADPLTELFAVSFAGKTLGSAAGKDYRLWQTQDLGVTWEIAPQGCGAFLFDTVYGLHHSSPQEGFAAGVSQNTAAAGQPSNAGAGTKYNSGYGWTCSSTYLGEIFYDVVRQGARGWVVGDTKGKIYRTETQGTSWTTVPAGTTQVLRGLWFFASGVGVAVGEGGTVVRSTDGAGNVWAAPSPPAPTSAALWDVFFFDQQNGWAVGASGVILKTGDGGVTWKLQPSGVQSRLEGVCFTSASEGWIVGEKAVLLHTTSGGL